MDLALVVDSDILFDLYIGPLISHFSGMRSIFALHFVSSHAVASVHIFVFCIVDLW